MSNRCEHCGTYGYHTTSQEDACKERQYATGVLRRPDRWYVEGRIGRSFVTISKNGEVWRQFDTLGKDTMVVFMEALDYLRDQMQPGDYLSAEFKGRV